MTSKITLHEGGGATLEGKDAMSLMHVVCVRQAIGLHIQSQGRLQITRGYGIMRALADAGKITGKTYRRKTMVEAYDDLRVTMEAMRAAIPTEDRRAPSSAAALRHTLPSQQPVCSRK